MLAEPPEISCCFASLKVNDKYQNYCKIKNILVCSLENLLLLNLALCHPRRLAKFGAPPPFIAREKCTSQQILDTNHKKIYNKKLSVSQISVRNATCDIELASDSLTNKLDAVH